MRRIKSTVTYTVPTWNFCNCDKLTMWGDTTKHVCKFCTLIDGEYACALYNASLTERNGLIQKTRECCRATAGFKSEIINDNVAFNDQPTIEPKVLMVETIKTYNQTIKAFMGQGLPYSMAAKLAEQHILNGGKL